MDERENPYNRLQTNNFQPGDGMGGWIKEEKMDEIKEIERRYPNTTCCNLICFAEKLQSEQRIKELEVGIERYLLSYPLASIEELRKLVEEK